MEFKVGDKVRLIQAKNITGIVQDNSVPSAMRVIVFMEGISPGPGGNYFLKSALELIPFTYTDLQDHDLVEWIGLLSHSPFINVVDALERGINFFKDRDINKVWREDAIGNYKLIYQK